MAAFDGLATVLVRGAAGAELETFLAAVVFLAMENPGLLAELVWTPRTGSVPTRLANDEKTR